MSHALLKKLQVLRDKLELRRDDLSVSEAALAEESRELQGGREQLERGQLLVDGLHRGRRHVLVGDALGELLGERLLVVLLEAELLLDLLELLHQQEAPLVRAHLVLDLLADLALQLAQLELLAQEQ